ncbi:DUF7504 family protein [Haladaptatus halobius]|uniref:DUF7504 family protein n=1 Tax=Haladaptatus halobius TaxID=2884875 RepID=UPI001D0AD4A9|nr:HalOD1 output domain-containing protein [Haladaptatus halobius]
MGTYVSLEFLRLEGERETPMTSEPYLSQDLFQPGLCHQVSVDENGQEPLSMRVSEAMATVVKNDPHEIPPLYDVIDPDALNNIFHPLSADTQQSGQSPTEILFSWCDHAVRVRQTGEISITNESIIPQIGTEAVLSAMFSAEALSDTDGVASEYAPAEDVGTAVVLAIADEVGVEPRELQEQLSDRINPDALTNLFGPKLDGTLRTGGYVSFAFQGYFVTVSSDGTITLQSELAQLKQDGGNVLVVGDVPDDVFNTTRSFLGGEPKPTQHNLFALLDRSPAALQQSATPRQPTLGTSEILDHQIPVRSAGASESPAEQPTQNTQITQIEGDLSNLRRALIQSLTRYEHDTDDSDMADLRLYMDSLRPILDDADTDVATFLQPLQHAVSAVGAVGYYLLPGDRNAPGIRELKADFDAVIELRIGTSGPEQRWSLRQTGYTTRWFSIN